MTRKRTLVSLGIALALASGGFWGFRLTQSANPNALKVTPASSLQGIGINFTLGIRVDGASSSYKGFQWKAAWDNATLDYVSDSAALPTGWLAAASGHGAGTAPGKEAAWAGGISTTSGTWVQKMWNLTVKCLAPGITTVYLEAIANDPHFGSATAEKPNEPHSMTLTSATVECAYLADLDVTKQGPSTFTAPGNLTYTVTAMNLGPNVAEGVQMVDTLPTGTGFVSAPGCTYDGVQRKVTCAVGSLGVSQWASKNITISVPSALAGTTLVNAVDVSGTTDDRNAANNHAEKSTTVDPSNVNITKTAPLMVDPGDSGQYQISVTSTGPSGAASVTVVDVLPALVGYSGASSTVGSCSYNGPSRTVTCNVGDLAASSSAVITINVTFPNQVTTVCNQASVTWAPSGSKTSGQRCTGVGNPDADGDGCSNEEELGSNPALGGQRDPSDPWDFYDVPAPTLAAGGTMANRDKAVSIGNDVLGVLEYAGTSQNGPPNTGPDGIPGTADDRDYDDDKDDNDVKDGIAYDRSSAVKWTGPPNGAIAIGEDVLLVLDQSGHNCQAPP
jgi:uncharacterized repeat protein (TIGR01451 family)